MSDEQAKDAPGQLRIAPEGESIGFYDHNGDELWHVSTNGDPAGEYTVWTDLIISAEVTP